MAVISFGEITLSIPIDSNIFIIDNLFTLVITFGTLHFDAYKDIITFSSSIPVIDTHASIYSIPSSNKTSWSVPSAHTTSAFGKSALNFSQFFSLLSIIFTFIPISANCLVR